MNRPEYILCWTDKHDFSNIFCNVKWCQTYSNYITSCPIHYKAYCVRAETFNNKKHIVIATLNKCNGKKFGCIYHNCSGCLVNVAQTKRILPDSIG